MNAPHIVASKVYAFMRCDEASVTGGYERLQFGFIPPTAMPACKRASSPSLACTARPIVLARKSVIGFVGDEGREE